MDSKADHNCVSPIWRPREISLASPSMTWSVFKTLTQLRSYTINATIKVPYYPLILPQLRPIGWISKRPPIAPILFPVGPLTHYDAGLPTIFFTHTVPWGSARPFYYGWKGPCLGVFPILQYKRPQGEEGFFLGISNLGWFDFSEVLCTWGHENWKKLSISFLWSFMYPWSWK